VPVIAVVQHAATVAFGVDEERPDHSVGVPFLANSVANYLGVGSDGCSLERFPDGQLRPTIETACGSDIYVIQPTTPRVNEHIVELLLLLDACRRVRAARVTAVIPHFGYARQDRRTTSGQALGLSVVADAIAAAGADRLSSSTHTPTLEAVCRIPVETLSAVPALSDELAGEVPDGAVVVAPDLGAVKGVPSSMSGLVYKRVRQLAHGGMKDRLGPALQPMTNRGKGHLNGVMICGRVGVPCCGGGRDPEVPRGGAPWVSGSRRPPLWSATTVRCSAG
jgi:N-terminal domain of ribose phosphate pyrophosphokinase